MLYRMIEFSIEPTNDAPAPFFADQFPAMVQQSIATTVVSSPKTPVTSPAVFVFRFLLACWRSRSAAVALRCAPGWGFLSQKDGTQ